MNVMSKNLKISLLQLNIKWENKEQNLARTEEWISKLPQNTDLIILPEMFATGFSMNVKKMAEKAEEGAIFKKLKEIAARQRAAVIASVIVSEERFYYNRLFFVQPSGEFASYDKRHLFSFAGEHKYYTGGQNLLNVQYKSWRIRPLICYDLRFPVWSRYRGDYDLLVYIANWPERRIDAWTKLLYARAIENQCYVAGVNRVGADGNGIEHSGDSVIIGPKGELIADALPGKETWLHAELDLRELYRFRKKFPALDDADDFNIII